MKKEENISRQSRDGMIVPAIIYQIIIPVERLCRNASFMFVIILHEVKKLINSSCQKTEILRLPPQDDIATQFPDPV